MNYKYVVKWIVVVSHLWFPGDTTPPGTPIYSTVTGQRYYEISDNVAMITESRDFAYEFYRKTVDRSAYYTHDPFALRQVEIDSFRTKDIMDKLIDILNEKKHN